MLGRDREREGGETEEEREADSDKREGVKPTTLSPRQGKARASISRERTHAVLIAIARSVASNSGNETETSASRSDNTVSKNVLQLCETSECRNAVISVCVGGCACASVSDECSLCRGTERERVCERDRDRERRGCADAEDREASPSSDPASESTTKDERAGNREGGGGP